MNQNKITIDKEYLETFLEKTKIDFDVLIIHEPDIINIEPILLLKIEDRDIIYEWQWYPRMTRLDVLDYNNSFYN